MKFKTVIGILVILAAILLVASPVLVCKASTAVIWTDKADYSPGETVTIFGSGFNLDANIEITITRPDGVVETDYTTSDASGEFVYYYALNGIVGTYTVTATDGTNSATTTFTDGTISVNIWGYTLLPSEGWTHGNVKGYYECQWVPYKIEVTSTKDESYTLTVVVHHDYYNGEWYGLNDVRNWQMSRNGISEDPSISGPEADGWYSGIQQLEYNWTFTIDPGDNCTLTTETHIAIGAHNWPGASVHTCIRQIYHIYDTTEDPLLPGKKDVSIVVEGPPLEADLAIEKTGVEYAHEGETITYYFTVTNYGPGSAVDVEVTDDVLGPITLSGLTDEDGDGLADDLAAGAYATGTATYTVPTLSEDITNTVTVTSTTTDTDLTNNQDGWTVDVLHPGISVVKSGPAEAHEDDLITYEFTITNTGDCPLFSVSVTDSLLGVIYSDGLDVGEIVVRYVDYLVPAPSEDIYNAVIASGVDNLGESVDASDDHTVDVLHPGISVVKSGPVAAAPGETITYTYTVENTGDCDLFDVSLVDDVLGTITLSGLIDLDGDGSADDLAMGATATGSAEYTIPTVAPEYVMNTAVATGHDIICGPAEGDASWSVHTMGARTIGYWKTHPEVWADWVAEEGSIFHGKTQEELLKYFPRNGAQLKGMNPLEMLRVQLLAAELNVHYFDAIFDYSRYGQVDIYATIDAAEAYLRYIYDDLGYGDDLEAYWESLTGEDRHVVAEEASYLYGLLDEFNNMGDEIFEANQGGKPSKPSKPPKSPRGKGKRRLH